MKNPHLKKINITGYILNFSMQYKYKHIARQTKFLYATENPIIFHFKISKAYKELLITNWC